MAGTGCFLLPLSHCPSATAHRGLSLPEGFSGPQGPPCAGFWGRLEPVTDRRVCTHTQPLTLEQVALWLMSDTGGPRRNKLQSPVTLYWPSHPCPTPLPHALLMFSGVLSQINACPASLLWDLLLGRPKLSSPNPAQLLRQRWYTKRQDRFCYTSWLFALLSLSKNSD